MRLSSCLCLAALCLSTPVLAHEQAPTPPRPTAPPPAPAAIPTIPPPTIAFTGGRWFDGNAFAPATWYSVGGRLTATRPARIDVTMDLTGRWVLPPFAEAHNHDAQSGRTAPQANVKNLRAGVFYSVQMCSRPDQRQDYAAFFNRPASMDVLFSDACISSSDGHPLGIALASMRQAGMEMPADEVRQRFYDPIDTIADLDRAWPQILARRPTLIKIILINSATRERDRANPQLFGYLGLDPALAPEIVRRAHAAGIRVAAHGDSAEDFAIIVRAGADIVAHLPGYRIAASMTAADYRIADDVIAEAARRRTVVVTTAGISRLAISRRPETAEPLRAMQIENLRRLRAAGVTLAMGSDDFMGTVVDEVIYLDGLGVMPRAELLRRATHDTPRMIFPDRQIGAFREGAEASLLAYDADPLADLAVLRTPRIRVKQGNLLAD